MRPLPTRKLFKTQKHMKTKTYKYSICKIIVVVTMVTYVQGMHEYNHVQQTELRCVVYVLSYSKKHEIYLFGSAYPAAL